MTTANPRELTIWVCLEGVSKPTDVRIVDSEHVSALCRAIISAFPIQLKGFGASDLVVRAPITPAQDADPTTWETLDNPKAKLAAVLKPNKEGEYEVCAALAPHEEAKEATPTEGELRILQMMWNSVLKLRAADSGKKAGQVERDVSTALVYDINFEEKEAQQEDTLVAYMLLLVSHHSKLQLSQQYELLFCEESEEFTQVMTFTMSQSLIHSSTKAEEKDYTILKLELDENVWDVSRGQAILKREEREPFDPSDRPKKRKAAERPTVVCKAPHLTYSMIKGQPVRVFGFGKASNKRTMLTTTVTSVDREFFRLQCDGMPGGAVTTKSGLQLLGFLGGASEPYGSSAIRSEYLPPRQR